MLLKDKVPDKKTFSWSFLLIYLILWPTFVYMPNLMIKYKRSLVKLNAKLYKENATL